MLDIGDPISYTTDAFNDCVVDIDCLMINCWRVWFKVIVQFIAEGHE